MTTQTEESERWLHFSRKTNREGVSVAVGVTVTGETETRRRGRQRHGDGVEGRRMLINRKCD